MFKEYCDKDSDNGKLDIFESNEFQIFDNSSSHFNLKSNYTDLTCGL